jgi:hypothetical protein
LYPSVKVVMLANVMISNLGAGLPFGWLVKAILHAFEHQWDVADGNQIAQWVLAQVFTGTLLGVGRQDRASAEHRFEHHVGEPFVTRW